MWAKFAGKKIYLDANIFIYSFETGHVWNDLLRFLFEAVDTGTIHAFTSGITVAEVLVKPLQVEEHELVRTYERVLGADSLIEVVPVDQSILRFSAELQGKLGIKLVDAVHVATARASACDLFLTHDDRLGRKLPREVAWLPLSGVGHNG